MLFLNSCSIYILGTDILSLNLGGGYRYEDGTSQATPIVAASLALIVSVLGKATNTYTNFGFSAKDILLNTIYKD